MHNKNLIFLLLNQSIFCGYSKEPSQWDGSFEHPNSVKTDGQENIYIFTLKNFVNLKLWGVFLWNLSSICLMISEKKIVLIHWWDSNILRSLFIKYELNWSSGFRGEDVWKCWRTDGCWGRMTDRARVTGILLAHPWAFGSGELKMLGLKLWKIYLTSIFTFVLGAQKNLPIEMILLST